MTSPLQQLLQRPDLWRPRDRRLPAENGGGLATGFDELDGALAGGGWPRAALTELLTARHGLGELRLLAPLLATLAARQLWQLWINPPFIPYAPALLQHGIDPAHLLIVRTEARQQLWACEQALRNAACGAVLYWPAAGPRYGELRKLQVAAAAQQGAMFLMRDTRGAAQPSPAALRLQLSADAKHLHVHILKQRNGNTGQRVLIPHGAALQPQLPMREQPAPGSAVNSRHLPLTRGLPAAPITDAPLEQVSWQ